MRFRIGQEITLRENRELKVIFGDMASNNFPKFGRVYKVSGYPMQGHPSYQDWLSLDELGPKHVFCEDIFEPVISSEQLEDDLWEIQMLGERLSDG